MPIVTSYLINRGSNLDAAHLDIISRVLGKSDNSATDLVLERINAAIGPLIVTQNMKTIGLKNTFLNGFFYLGAPPLSPRPVTPGNSRTDISTDPDPYSQTTPSEMGRSLRTFINAPKTEAAR